MNAKPGKLGSVWAAAAGNGVFLTSADQWRGVSTSTGDHRFWKAHQLKELLNGGKTHHIVCGFGDYKGGRFVAVGDNHHVFFSDSRSETWKSARIPKSAGQRQEAVIFGNGVFLVSYRDRVARSSDGGS